MDLANFDLNFSFSISDVESSQTASEDDRSTQPYSQSQPQALPQAQAQGHEEDIVWVNSGLTDEDYLANPVALDDDYLPEAENPLDEDYLPDQEQHNDDHEIESDTDEQDEGGEDQEPQGRLPQRSRFAEMDASGLQDFIVQQANPRTRRKTKGHVRLFREFLESKGETRAPHDIQHDVLNDLLALFFVTVRKEAVDDPDYEPSSLKGMQSSIERHLKENNYGASIITSGAFFGSREAIKSRCKELKKSGKGNRQFRKRAPTQAELDTMWQTGALGSGSPKSLQQTMWWIMCTRFGKRGNEENRTLQWGDVRVEKSATGLKYPVSKERVTKTRQGDNCSDVTSHVKVFEEKGDPACPVLLFETFATRRPEEMRQNGTPFYLQPKFYSSVDQMQKDPTWYKRQVRINIFDLHQSS